MIKVFRLKAIKINQAQAQRKSEDHKINRSDKTKCTSPNWPSPSFSLKVSFCLGNSCMDESAPVNRLMSTPVMEWVLPSEDSCRLMMSASA